MHDLQGVALLLFGDGNMRAVYMVREQKSKPQIAKRAGMLSVPMETMEPGESPLEAVERLLVEEVGLSTNGITPIGRLHFEATEGTIPYTLHCFIAVVDRTAPFGQHTDTDDVEPIGWQSVNLLTTLTEQGRRELPSIAALFQEYTGQ